MIDYLLVLIIIALGVFIYFKDKEQNKQVNKLLSAIMARSPQDYKDLKLADHTNIKVEPNKQMAKDLPVINDQSEYISLSQATDEQFMDAIHHELEEPDPEEEKGFFN